TQRFITAAIPTAHLLLPDIPVLAHSCLQCYAHNLDLHSFPTRRSSDLKMGKVMRHTLGASLNIRHNLSSSKGPKPLQLKLLTTYIPKTSAFTLAFSTSQRLRTTRASARTFFTFRHYITPSARNF